MANNGQQDIMVGSRIPALARHVCSITVPSTSVTASVGAPWSTSSSQHILRFSADRVNISDGAFKPLRVPSIRESWKG